MFGRRSSIPLNKHSSQNPLSGLKKNETSYETYITPDIICGEDLRNIYNMPFLLDRDGTPWNEANSFLYDLVANKHIKHRPTDEATRIASSLLDYKIFTEENNIDWLDFSARRLPLRPTYRYFHHLVHEKGYAPRVVNQHTGNVYRFYEYVARYFHNIDMQRVDKVETIKVHFEASFGYSQKDVTKRSQTKKITQRGNSPTGYVLDDGELLRPLHEHQIAELRGIVSSDDWSAMERLIVSTALNTGARKQSILTLRVGDIEQLEKMIVQTDKSPSLRAGPGTLIDTKNSKTLTLNFPKKLVQELSIFSKSKAAKARRDKFKAKFKKDFPNLEEIADKDMYLFISNQGNCYYMAKSDPRYPIVKRVPKGQVVKQLKEKILKTSTSIPREFYFHWLRATYAYILWLGLIRKNEEMKLGLSNNYILNFIAKMLGHEDSSTTENYLKLFKNPDRFGLEIQELVEDILISDDWMSLT